MADRTPYTRYHGLCRAVRCVQRGKRFESKAGLGEVMALPLFRTNHVFCQAQIDSESEERCRTHPARNSIAAERIALAKRYAVREITNKSRYIERNSSKVLHSRWTSSVTGAFSESLLYLTLFVFIRWAPFPRKWIAQDQVSPFGTTESHLANQWPLPHPPQPSLPQPSSTSLRSLRKAA